MSGRFFSDSWYRVEALRVSVRPHVRVHRHRYQGTAWYVLEDRVSGKSHRVSIGAYHLVGRMDGRRTVDGIWHETVEALGDRAPSQDDVLQLLAQLHSADLLRSEGSPDTLELLERHGKQAGKLTKQNLMSPMSFRVPLWDPDSFLERTLPLVRPLIGPAGFIAWLVLIGSAGLTALRVWPELTNNLADRVLLLDNVLLMLVIYPFVKALHELGHGYVAKRYGAEVHEVGIMFLVLFPVPYVDASGTNAFRSKWQRAAVAAAGIMAELAICAVAILAWTTLEPGFVRAVAFNTILITGFSTVLVNGNPLLRFDGYFVMSDLLEVPNLSRRASKYWGHLVERYLFRARGIRDFHATFRERLLFLIYAPAAYVYRVLLTFGIALFVASKFFIVGVVLGLWSLATGIGKPLVTAIWHVFTSPRLRRERRRAVTITCGAMAAVALVFGLIRAPISTTAEGVLWTPDTAVLRAGAVGFVAEVRADVGESVKAGDILLRLYDPLAEAELRVLAARVTELRLRHDQEKVSDPVLSAITELELADAEAALSKAQAEEARRELRATASGRFEPAIPLENLIGRFAREGEVLGHVLPDRPDTIRAVVSQWDIDLVRERLRAVRLLLPGHVWTSYPTTLVREIPAGGFSLPSPALGLAGGGSTPTNPGDENGTTAIARVFQLELAAPPEARDQGFGARVLVKFEHQPEPVIAILWRRARQLFMSTFDV